MTTKAGKIGKMPKEQFIIRFNWSVRPICDKQKVLRAESKVYVHGGSLKRLNIYIWTIIKNKTSLGCGLMMKLLENETEKIC